MKRSIQIISPHIDDAILSMGGAVRNLLKRDEHVTIQYVFTVSNWTNRDAICEDGYPPDVDTITGIRKNEESDVAVKLGYTFKFLDFVDFPFRDQHSEETERDLVDRIADTLIKSCGRKDIFIVPLASGLKHPDHDIVRSASRKLIALGCMVFFYEDLPYAARSCHDHKNTFRVMTESGYRPEIFEIDIELKESLLRCYKSQMSDEWLGYVKSYSYNLFDNNHYERIWVPIGAEKITQDV
ncbi:MAG: PIG-L family deacetylase [Chryseotalea sp. WA131a]|nr:MAG: PIG-L family deacetylase [Chryseotalea sp. WA131a]